MYRRVNHSQLLCWKPLFNIVSGIHNNEVSMPSPTDVTTLFGNQEIKIAILCVS